jgi:hypothetical protein
LQPFFHPIQNPSGTAGGCGHVKMIFANAGGYAIIHDHAIIFQHQAIAAFANPKLAPRIGIKAVQKFSRIPPANINFAKR